MCDINETFFFFLPYGIFVFCVKRVHDEYKMIEKTAGSVNARKTKRVDYFHYIKFHNIIDE